MPFLLDVNVLIARIDPRHEHHERVARWERDNASEHLVTCPLTQNGFVRIYGHPRYPGGPGSPAEAMVELRHLLSLRTHRFISDSLPLSDTGVFRVADRDHSLRALLMETHEVRQRRKEAVSEKSLHPAFRGRIIQEAQPL